MRLVNVKEGTGCQIKPIMLSQGIQGKEKEKGDEFMTKSDYKKMKEAIIGTYGATDCYDVDIKKHVEKTAKNLEDFSAILDTVYLSNVAFKHPNEPYVVTNPLMILDLENKQITFFFVQGTTVDKLQKKKKSIMEKISVLEQVMNPYFNNDDFTYNYTLAYVGDDNQILSSPFQSVVKVYPKDYDKYRVKLNPIKEHIELKIDEIDKTDLLNYKCKKCEYFNTCVKKERSILDFDGWGDWSKINKYIEKYKTIDVIPIEDQSLWTTINNVNFKLSLENLEEVIDKQNIRSFLNLLKVDGVQHLDFEGYMSIFKVDGHKNNDQIPFSYSIHKVDEDNKIKSHHSYIVDPLEDTFEGLVDKFVRDINPINPIVVYNKEYEMKRIEKMIEMYPKYELTLSLVLSNIVDLYDVFRQGWYRNISMKKTGLKDVYKALCGDKYDSMEIHDGVTASVTFKNMFDNDIKNIAELDEIIKYNTQDTLAQIEVIDELIKKVGAEL